MQFEIRIERPPWGGLSIWIILREGDRRYFVEPLELVFKEIEQGRRLDRPSLSIDERYAGPFMEALKRAVEQVDMGPVEGELKATKYHLEDMRKLIFEKTVIELRKPLYVPAGFEDELIVRIGRVKEAIKKCPEARNVLKAIFPDVID